jgi:hypothetical protein
MTAMMLETVPFPQTGDTLWARRDEDGRVFVAVKPICEAIGLDWHSQRQRIHRTPALAEGEVMITSPSGGGMQQALCLPLDLIPGWLFGVDVNRVKPALRDRLIAYQRECHRVLFDHFSGTIATALDLAVMDEASPVEQPDETAGSLPGPDRAMGLWLGLIREARLIAGTDAARRLWDQSPLPPLDATPRGLAPDWTIPFLADRTEAVRGARVAADDLWLTYLEWCGGRAIDPVGRRVFGRALGERLRTVKSSRIYYLDLRLKR